jgi:dipeptidase E
MTDRHIVAMGGGGFSFGRDWEGLDDYVLGLVDAPIPRVCFLPTATGDSDEYIVRFYDSFERRNCAASHLKLFTRTVTDLREYLLDKHVIYVGGGNTANLLAVWRLHGVDAILRDAWATGVVMCGESAGGLCWFEGGTTDSFGLDLAALHDGLGLLSGSFSPHYDGEPKRRPAYHRFVADGSLPDGLAADNGVGLHFVGTELAEAVATRAGQGAFRVELVDGEVRETPIEARPLPGA